MAADEKVQNKGRSGLRDTLEHDVLGWRRPGEKRGFGRRIAIFLGYPPDGLGGVFRRSGHVQGFADLFRSRGRGSVTPDAYFHLRPDASNAEIEATARRAAAAGVDTVTFEASEDFCHRLWPYLNYFGIKIAGYRPPRRLVESVRTRLDGLRKVGGAPEFLALWACADGSPDSLRSELRRSALYGWVGLCATTLALAWFLRCLLDLFQAPSLEFGMVAIYALAFAAFAASLTFRFSFSNFQLRNRRRATFAEWASQPREWLPVGEIES